MFWFWCLLIHSFHSLLIHKKISGSFVKNRNLTVSITLYNKASHDLVDLTLHDQTFNNASAFKIISGMNYQKLSLLKANHSQTLSFVVLPKKSGPLTAFPAVAKYKDASSEQQMTSFSTFQPLFIKPVDPWTDFLYQLLGLAGFLTFCVTVYVLLTKVSHSSTKEKKKSF
jgi:hypothetical protein